MPAIEPTTRLRCSIGLTVTISQTSLRPRQAARRLLVQELAQRFVLLRSGLAAVGSASFASLPHGAHDCRLAAHRVLQEAHVPGWLKVKAQPLRGQCSVRCETHMPFSSFVVIVTIMIAAAVADLSTSHTGATEAEPVAAHLGCVPALPVPFRYQILTA